MSSGAQLSLRDRYRFFRRILRDEIENHIC